MDELALPDGGWLTYRVWPSASAARPLLLLRPLGGSTALWEPLVTELGGDRPVVAFDPRGVGSSSDAPLLQTTRQMAADALALLDGLDIDCVDVFGLSLGGMVATWLAIDARLRVGRLVLASLVTHRDVSLRAVGRALSLASRFVEGERGVVRAVMSREFRRRYPALVGHILDEIRAHPSTRRNLAVRALAALRYDGEPFLPGIFAPTLLLFGGLDPLANEHARFHMLDKMPHAEMAVLPGVGHDLSLEEPNATAAEIQRFLA
jgi:pimeloyl-ACP methyl ester carboxylesterase